MAKLTAKNRAKIFLLARRGLTDVEIGQIVGIADRTLRRWKLRSLDFLDELNRCKAQADGLVERSLFERAVGDEWSEEHLAQNADGSQTVVTLRKRLPPDPACCIFWLKNRKSEDWKDRRELLPSPATINIIYGHVTPQLQIARPMPNESVRP